MFRRTFACAFALLAAMAVAAAGGAWRPAHAATVKNIVIEGNRGIDDETIRARLGIPIGRNLSREDADRAVKTLFETGLFADVRIAERGGTLVVTVEENPIINRISFEGNSKYKDADIANVVESKERGVFTRARVQADVQRILELYRRTGRFQAFVEPKVIELPEHRVNLVFEVTEGPKTGVSRISFIGNQAYSDAKLRQVIDTRQTGLLSFLRKGDTYDPDRLTGDEEKLRQYYANRGYADFAVVSSLADLDRERNEFFITFTVDEGARYRFGQISVDSIVPGIDPQTIRGLVLTDPGEVYSAKEIDESLEAITLDLAGSGYAFAEVRTRLERHPETGTVDVTYVVDEGPRAYIERIDIQGNTRTRDYVVRREFDISEGDAYNRVLLDRAERRLKGMGYFKDVKITTQPGSQPDRDVVNVNVD